MTKQERWGTIHVVLHYSSHYLFASLQTVLLQEVFTFSVETGEMDPEVSEKLLQAMRKVESAAPDNPNGDENAVGDGGKAIGVLQIWESYWKDAVERSGIGGSYKDCKGDGSTEYSKRVIRAYMQRYANSRRLRRQATDEDIARIHNGGPNGYEKPETLGYWEKVKARM